MKKQLFLTFLIGFFVVSVTAQDRVIADFEDGDTVFHVSGPNMVGTIVDNPKAAGINTSTKVLKVKTTADWNEELVVNPEPALNFYTHPMLSFKAYATDTITLAIRFDRPGKWEQYLVSPEFPLNDIVNFVIEGDDTMKWVEFTYDMSLWDNISGYNHILKIMNTDHSRVDSFYIDDVKMIQRSPAFDNTTIVPIFYDPVTTIKWVGNWAGGVAANENVYRIEKDGFNMLSTDTILMSLNGYTAYPNDTIAGSSGGASYILFGAGADSIIYHDNGLKFMHNYTPSLTFPDIYTGGAGDLSLKFDLGVFGSAYTSGMKPKVEAKFADSANWVDLTLSNLPDADSTWTTVTADIAGAGSAVSIRFTNEIPFSADSMQFWIDDITVLSTVTVTESIDPQGEGGLTEVTVGGTLQMELNPSPAGASVFADWDVSDEAIATITSDGLLSGVAEGSVWVYAATTDGTNITDSVQITVQTATIMVTGITVTSDVASVTKTDPFANLTATIAPANASDKTVTWSVSDGALASITPAGLLRGLADGTVTVTATANDGSGITGTLDIDISGFVTPVNDIDVESVGLYPNPIKSRLTIKVDFDIREVEIFGIDGTCVLHDDTGTSVLNVESLKSGIYIIHVMDQDNVIHETKFVKE